MLDKRVILIIVVFIGACFMIYSFANPLSNEELTPNEPDTQLPNDNNGNTTNPGNNNQDNEEKPGNNEETEDKEENNNIQTGGNTGTTQPPTKPTNPVKPVDPKPVIAYSKFTMQSNSGLSLAQTNKSITVNGSISKEYSNEIDNNYVRVTFKIEAPTVYTKDQLSKMYFKDQYGKNYSGLTTLDSTDFNSKAYFYVNVDLRIEDTIQFVVYWGTGNAETYTIKNNVKVTIENAPDTTNDTL